ncbi:MAG: metalloregulator ArsR/SmtB family transcription factor [Pirellulales bacterium]
MNRKKVQLDKIFHALGDPTRRSIVEHLGKRSISASKLAVALGITVTAVGQHLKILENCGLAASEKKGRVRICRAESSGILALENWIHYQRTAWQERMDRLDDLLNDES